MNYEEVLDVATRAVLQLKGHLLDVLTVKKPYDLQSAIDLSKVISKLSPIVGNTLESTLTRYLNAQEIWPEGCTWKRRDPEFPDILLTGMPEPEPGIEVKAWFPLATEITARFRDSQTLLQNHNTKVVVICWMPEFVIAGKPKVVDMFVCDALEFAIARDTHYHRPPEYIVIEPGDTSLRIGLESLEDFKRHILTTMYIDRTIQDWINAIRRSYPEAFTNLIDPTSPIPIT